MKRMDDQPGFLLWVQASRPRTLPAAAAPVLIGSAMAFASHSAHWLSALAALVGALFIQIGTNFANDYYDSAKGADTTDRLGPTRLTAAGLIRPEQMKKAMVIAFALALLVGVYLVWRGGWPIIVIGILSLLFGFMYTGGPMPLGYIGLGDLFVLIFFGPVAVGGTYYVQTLAINSEVLIAGLAPGLLSMAILTVNNLRDIDTDRCTGKKTLAVRFGAVFSQWEYLFCLVMAAIIPLLLWQLSGKHTYALAASLILIPAVPAIRTAFTRSGAVLNELLSDTGKLLLLYAMLFSIGWQL